MFSPNGPIGRFLTKLLDQLTLNILFTACCLPIITIGAASAALYSCQYALAEERTSSLFSTFWNGFRKNFKQATGLFLIVALVGAFLGIALYAAVIQGFLGSPITIVIACLALFVYLGTVSWLFPLVARYEQSARNQLYNAYALSVAKLPFTVLMVAVNVWWLPALLVMPVSLYGSYLFVVTFCAAAVASLINSRLLLRILPQENDTP